MRADLRLGQIRSGQMKKDPPRSESDPLKIHISEIITALVWTPRLLRSCAVLYTGQAEKHAGTNVLHNTLNIATLFACKAGMVHFA